MYNIQYANLDNTDYRSKIVIKDNSYNFQYLSLEDNILKKLSLKNRLI